MSAADQIRDLARLHPLLRTADDTNAVGPDSELDDKVIVAADQLKELLADTPIDFLVTDLDGGMTAILPLTDEAEVWFKAKVECEEWRLRPGIGVVIEQRDAADLIEVIRTETPFTVGT